MLFSSPCTPHSLSPYSLLFPKVLAWYRKAQLFRSKCKEICQMFARLTAVPNRPLLYDIYQYMWDAKEAVMLLDSYVTWLGTCIRMLICKPSIIISLYVRMYRYVYVCRTRMLVWLAFSPCLYPLIIPCLPLLFTCRSPLPYVFHCYVCTVLLFSFLLSPIPSLLKLLEEVRTEMTTGCLPMLSLLF